MLVKIRCNFKFSAFMGQNVSALRYFDSDLSITHSELRYAIGTHFAL